MITRNQALNIVQQALLPQITSLYALSRDDLHVYPGYEGCQNLVFFYTKNAMNYVLRISYRDDRTTEQIRAEIDFIHYLHAHGVRVSRAVKSQQDCYVEEITTHDQQFILVAFERAPGHRLPDKGYQYRDQVSTDEYFYNWGHILGQMHRLTQQYTLPTPQTTRPQWVDIIAEDYLPHYLPPSLSTANARFMHLLAHAKTWSTEKAAFGLIHGDFSDGNFTIDYTNGNITAFDFDDAAYCWFMYDLADAWRSGVGWTMFEPNTAKRQEFMHRYFETLLSGYAHENALENRWLNQLPLFLKLVEMEALLSEFREMSLNEDDIEYDGEVLYQLKCVEDDIPYFGFFESIYSHEHPFCLPDR